MFFDERHICSLIFKEGLPVLKGRVPQHRYTAALFLGADILRACSSAQIYYERVPRSRYTAGVFLGADILRA
nr:hypothetical protein Itr_chr11CG14760 [Ipomoea trifida]